VRPNPPQVRPGQPITAQLVRQMREAVLATRIRPGAHVRASETREGTILDFDGGGGAFIGAFFVSLSGDNAVAIQPGTINGIPATIKGKALDDEPAPLLEWRRLKVDSEGRGWIAAEITCDPEAGWAVESVEMVQVADLNTDDGAPGLVTSSSGEARTLEGNRGRFAVAMLRQRADGRLDVYQIAYHSLRHRVAFRTAGPPRHFFW
jgi:hypothetical protein